MARGRKPKQQSKGLGDTIENFTEATGIKKVIETISEVTGIDCGCEERKKYLNKKFNYRKKIVHCPTDEQIEWYKNFQQTRTLDLLSKTGRVESKELDMLEIIYMHINGFSKYRISRCCAKTTEIIALISFLDEVFKDYN